MFNPRFGVDFERIEVFDDVAALNAALAAGAVLIGFEKLGGGSGEHLVFVAGYPRQKRVVEVPVNGGQAKANGVQEKPAGASPTQLQADERASEKQVSYIKNLVSKFPSFEADVAEYLGKKGVAAVGDLTRDQATELLDALVEKSKSMPKREEGGKITQKQMKLIMTLANEIPQGQFVIDGYLAECGVDTLGDLTLSQASALIALLKSSKLPNEQVAQ